MTTNLGGMITLTYTSIRDAQNIILLILALAPLPAFSFWMGRQERRGQPALIPNSLWRNVPFLAICVSMFFTWAAFNTFQYQSTLYFQDVQNLSSLQASIRFLPMAVVGILTNSATAYLVPRVNVNLLLGISALVTAVSPILMALANSAWIYWTAAVIAMTLSPLNGDETVLWTVSSLVISRSFPGDSQALAGGVFNTISQLGNCVGLAITAAIAASVTAHHGSDGSSAAGLSRRVLDDLRRHGVGVCGQFAGLTAGGKGGDQTRLKSGVNVVRSLAIEDNDWDMFHTPHGL
ncbi:MFS general substrate transporter [Aspergillus sclerotiicarbonarius CBS 121057]|uniref:MFS general substrate transporter n=1 Tax=Aspergillus sclerotiicarbonarius (strain CBS 121057 / IBT 28362) TaxID=1448318 RepID=A0A319F756_ASPSB|nr:MFS general substrate transporter [Aspergillus sclerotiicarbonarius CBS 121057]